MRRVPFGRMGKPGEPGVRSTPPPQLVPDDGGAPRERLDLSHRHVARERHHAAVRARNDVLGRHVLHRLANCLRDFPRRLDPVRRHVDHAHHHVLALQHRQHAQGHARPGTLQRDLIDRAPGEHRKGLLVLPPLVAERALPVDIGLDAVAVADVHGGLALEPLGRALQRLDAPGRHLVQIDVVRRLVELDHVHAHCFQLARLLVQDLRELHGERGAVPVVLVRQRVHDRHRPGHGELQRARRVGARVRGFRRVNRAAPRDGRNDARAIRFVAVVPDPDALLVLEIHPVDVFQDAVHEVLPEHLAIGDDVQPGIFLQLEHHQRGVPLSAHQLIARQPPGRPQRRRLGEPARLGKTAHDGGRKHGAFRRKSGSGPFTARDTWRRGRPASG